MNSNVAEFQNYKLVRAGVLDVAYREVGDPAGWPVVLVHGFPYDAHSYDAAAGLLAAEGARVIAPWMRGYGPTRFHSSATMRSGQQGAFGADLKALLDGLGIQRAILGGFDWGGRAACIVAALWPERVDGLVSVLGYNIFNRAQMLKPVAPLTERRMWYTWYFQSPRGPVGLDEHRYDFCRLLWEMWSPSWNFDEETYSVTAKAFENPDFVDVVIHSYRHRFGLVEGDPAYDEIEQRLEMRPSITVPAIILDGDSDGLLPLAPVPDLSRFAARSEYRVAKGAGHNLPQEKPGDFAEAVKTLRSWSHPR